MNIKTNLLEEYVNFVDNTKKQNKHFKIFITLIVIIMFVFLFFVLLYNIKKLYSNKKLYSYMNCTHIKNVLI